MYITKYTITAMMTAETMSFTEAFMSLSTSSIIATMMTKVAKSK